MILPAYRHGLRVSELVDLRWDQIDFNHGNLAVRRVKQGSPSTHPIRRDELREFITSPRQFADNATAWICSAGRCAWLTTLCKIHDFRTKLSTLKKLMIFCAKDMHKSEVLR
jgi:type 1 fimbriae regulatory protein FimB/type 1 fimbriae regulatory protein FimE